MRFKRVSRRQRPAARVALKRIAPQQVLLQSVFLLPVGLPQGARDQFGSGDDVAALNRIEQQDASLLLALSGRLGTTVPEPQAMALRQTLCVDSAVVDQHRSLWRGGIVRWPDQTDVDLDLVALCEPRQAAGRQRAVGIVDLMKIPDAVRLAA